MLFHPANEAVVILETLLGFPDGWTIGLAAVSEPNAEIDRDLLLSYFDSSALCC